jgi:hypothetical protein
VQGWIVKLSTVSEIIEQWLMVQNMWMYMEAVFSGGDIVKQLPQEAKRFQNIDKNYMKVSQRCVMVFVLHGLPLGVYGWPSLDGLRRPGLVAAQCLQCKVL